MSDNANPEGIERMDLPRDIPGDYLSLRWTISQKKRELECLIAIEKAILKYRRSKQVAESLNNMSKDCLT